MTIGIVYSIKGINMPSIRSLLVILLEKGRASHTHTHTASPSHRFLSLSQGIKKEDLKHFEREEIF